MAKQQASVVQDGVDQIKQAVRRADREFKKIQKQVESRRRVIEKQAQRGLARIQKQIQSQPLVKRAEALRADATERIERGVTSILDVLPIATKSEIDRIDRKVSALGRKLKEIEKAQGSSQAA